MSKFKKLYKIANWKFVKEGDERCIEKAIWSDDTSELNARHRIFGINKMSLNKTFRYSRIFPEAHSVWYCELGQLKILTPKGERLLTKGQCAIIPAEVPSDIRAGDSAELKTIVIDIGPHPRWGSLVGEDVRVFDSAALSRISKLLDYLYDEIQQNYPNRELMNQLLIDQIALVLERDLRDKNFVVQNEHRLTLIELFRTVEQKLEYPWTMRELAERINVSETHFFRLCKQHLGESPKKRLNRLRMNSAKSMLTHTQKTITEIAFLVGFSNPLNFSTAFKKSVSCSPRDFRAEHGLVI